jgi:hypothetical protein
MDRESEITAAAKSATEPEQAPPPSGAAGAVQPSMWDHAVLVARAFGEWLSQPRVRLAVTGVILLVIGGLQLTSSVWTLPLVLVGALMVVTAWIGHRLEGRFAVEWGKTGTQLEFRARIKAPQKELLLEPGPEQVEVIDGEAHTVEIEVAELKALLAAVESKEAGIAPPEAAADAIRILRVAADGGDSAEAER